MKSVTKLFLLLSILYSSLFASIDEYKSDLYYANGIMINDSEEKATEIWQIEIEGLFENKQDSYENLERIQNSYNRSQGFFDDLFESLEQKISNEFGWKQLSAHVTAFLTLHNIQDDWNAHTDDLIKQVTSYKQSIKDGHGVIVIAHSQGNYYTNEAYEKLDAWMKEYFHMFGVATLANHVAGFNADDTTAPYVKFHNDFIGLVMGGLDSNREDSHHGGFPNIEAHDFNSYLSNDETREDIVNFIETKIQEQVDAQSQWVTDEESDENTKEYRITVKHMHDDTITLDAKIYPFSPNKKLYQVPNPLYPEDEEKKVYVKASYGGEMILSADEANDWEAGDNQFYKLEGTDPVEYIEGESCQDPSLFEVIAHENKYTESWRVTVKNIETNETQSYVYPFNLHGSLYKLDNSGEWVLASCGGINILSIWAEQKEKELLKLENTEDIIISGRFIRDDDIEVVVDTETGCMWQDDVEAKTVKKPWTTWTNYINDNFVTSGDTAVSYCQNLSLGGYSDWRLPELEELKSIVDRQRRPAIDREFLNVSLNRIGGTGWVSYWSSSTDVNSYKTKRAWHVRMGTGDYTTFNKNFSFYVRCVRDGQ